MVSLPGGDNVPALGIGTWRMGERGSQRGTEVRALRTAIEAGIRLIDTAEMYGEGGAEKVVGEAIKAHEGRRDELFIVSKVYPHNASASGVVKACERSLARMDLDYIDVYLLHWRGGADIEDTLNGFSRLLETGKIRHAGVSNFDADDMREWYDLPGGKRVATNQVLYNLVRRWPESGLLPWQRARGIPTMAYTPLEPLSRRSSKALSEVARKHDVSEAQVCLAWLLRDDDVIAIPKAANVNHVKDNVAALNVTLDQDDLKRLDQAYPPPDGEAAIEML